MAAPRTRPPAFRHPGPDLDAHPAAPSVTDAAHERLHRGAPHAISAAAVVALRQAGERVTGSRRAVLDVLASRSEHLSADQVATILEAAPTPVHRATVYRTLDRLTEISVATAMQVAGGATVYHLASTEGGHEHLHARCRRCGTIAVLPLEPLLSAAGAIESSGDFRLELTHSTFVGLSPSRMREAGRVSPQSPRGGRLIHWPSRKVRGTFRTRRQRVAFFQLVPIFCM